MESLSIRSVALLGNHLPRQCGIATFTSDLSTALAAELPHGECFVLAMNEPGQRHAYPDRVRFEVEEDDLVSYQRAADFLNVNQVDVLCLQHEYGIFGGKAGSNVLALVRELRMPVVTTLHTLLSEPSTQQRAAMDELLTLSERVVVMTEHGNAVLRSVHGLDPHKIDLIPHGIPAVPSVAASKDALGLEGKQVILTFGLLSPDKGIESVIDALPTILARHPNAVYVVLGATHPHVREHHGEEYRLSLENRALELGVASSIIFHDRFVSQRELSEFLKAADVYVTPYLNTEQITSGTLAYAVGFGKAVVSTPYRHALDLLANERGVIVPVRDPAATAKAIADLLGDDAGRHAMEQRARKHAMSMSWPSVAHDYMTSFERARETHGARRHTAFRAKTLAEREPLPTIRLDHVATLTDDTGMFQHAAFDVPRYEDGYCLDDNARALLLMTMLEDESSIGTKSLRPLMTRYLAFVKYAFNPSSGRFRNFMSYSRRWTEEVGSEDCHGRALWALGGVVGRLADPSRRNLAGSLFHSALPAVRNFTSPRAWAYTLLGIHEYLKAFRGDTSVETTREILTHELVALHRAVSTADWPWFEDRVTYCNARLPHALILSKGDEAAVSIGLRSLEWLHAIQTTDGGYFAPIGSNGFLVRGQARATFDQQPVEAAAMTSACLAALELTKDERWMVRARRAFQWFLGQNQIHTSLYDPRTGGCRDGLHPDRVNENQGAESTLSFLLSLLDMRAAMVSR